MSGEIISFPGLELFVPLSWATLNFTYRYFKIFKILLNCLNSTLLLVSMKLRHFFSFYYLIIFAKGGIPSCQLYMHIKVVKYLNPSKYQCDSLAKFPKFRYLIHTYSIEYTSPPLTYFWFSRWHFLKFTTHTNRKI